MLLKRLTRVGPRSDLAFVEGNELDYYLQYLPVLLNEMTSDHFGDVPSLPKEGSTNNLMKDFILEDFQAIFADPKVNIFFLKSLDSVRLT